MSRCKEMVSTPGVWSKSHQCSRKEWRDGWCKQHHPDSVDARRKLAEERYKQQQENSPWRRLQKKDMEIEQLKSELSALREAAHDAVEFSRDYFATGSQEDEWRIKAGYEKLAALLQQKGQPPAPGEGE